jgi:hypothetical protein
MPLQSGYTSCKPAAADKDDSGGVLGLLDWESCAWIHVGKSLSTIKGSSVGSGGYVRNHKRL